MDSLRSMFTETLPLIDQNAADSVVLENSKQLKQISCVFNFKITFSCRGISLLKFDSRKKGCN